MTQEVASDEVGGTGVVTVRLPAEMLAKMDGVAGAGKRSTFIRGAVEAALNGGIERKPVPAAKPVGDRPKVRPTIRMEQLPEDCLTLLAAIEGAANGLTCREAARQLDWAVARAGGAEDVLSKYEFIHYPDGRGVMQVRERADG